MQQLPLDLYPRAPGFKRPGGASEEAARRIAPRAATLRTRALDVLAAHPAGLTADEVAHELRCSILSVRPRISELLAQDLIQPTTARHRNESGHSATVWRLRP